MQRRGRSVELDQELYPFAAVDAARSAFAEYCETALEQRVSDQDRCFRLTVMPRDGTPPDTIDEFLNYALCAAAELHLSRLSHP